MTRRQMKCQVCPFKAETERAMPLPASVLQSTITSNSTYRVCASHVEYYSQRASRSTEYPSSALCFLPTFSFSSERETSYAQT